MTRAVIYLKSYTETFRHEHPSLPNGFEVSVHHPKPLDLQERACLTYCERVGHTVVDVFKATTPPPDNVEYHFVITNTPKRGDMKLEKHAVPGMTDTYIYWTHYSNHPYYQVMNALEHGKADMTVRFTEDQPSFSIWGHLPPEEAKKKLEQIEYASLWEIEPPTDARREIFYLVETLIHATSEEERATLSARIEELAEQDKEEQRQRAAKNVPPKNTSTSTATWQYCTLVFDPGTNTVVKLRGDIHIEGVQPQMQVPVALETAGSQGWEVVGIYQAGQQSQFLLKRPVEHKADDRK